MWDTMKNFKTHWWRITDYLELFKTEGVTLNHKKFQFTQLKIDFAGFFIGTDTVKPLPKYL